MLLRRRMMTLEHCRILLRGELLLGMVHCPSGIVHCKSSGYSFIAFGRSHMCCTSYTQACLIHLWGL